MSKNKRQSGHKGEVSITIGGNVGPASAIGKDNQVTANNVAGESVIQGTSEAAIDRENFLKLIQQLQTKVSELENEFETDDAQEVEERLAKVAQLSTRDQPPVERMKRDLEIVYEIVKDTAAVGTVAAPILPIAKQVWEMFLHLFGM